MNFQFLRCQPLTSSICSVNTGRDSLVGVEDTGWDCLVQAEVRNTGWDSLVVAEVLNTCSDCLVRGEVRNTGWDSLVLVDVCNVNI
jgi:hypothetical protein